MILLEISELQKLLDKALVLSTKKHSGQTDRSGNPYALHPLTVADHLHFIGDKIVAVLHDIIEDTDMTCEGLLILGFPKIIVDAVDALSKRDNETIEEYYKRVSENPISVRVKIADLEHNMDIRRLPKLTEKDLKRLVIYHANWIKLKKMNL